MRRCDKRVWSPSPPSWPLGNKNTIVLLLNYWLSNTGIHWIHFVWLRRPDHQTTRSHQRACCPVFILSRFRTSGDRFLRSLSKWIGQAFMFLSPCLFCYLGNATTSSHADVIQSLLLPASGIFSRLFIYLFLAKPFWMKEGEGTSPDRLDCPYLK